MLRRDQCRLRPIDEADLALVLKWRNSEYVRKYMYTDHTITADEHQAWFQMAQQDRGSRHLIFEIDCKPAGVINVTALESPDSVCHWGFYIGESNAPQGTGTLMGVLALEYIFDELHVRKCVGEVFAFNEASLRYHKRLGFVEEGRLKAHTFKQGRYEDVVIMGHISDRWAAMKDALYQQYFACEVGV
jgi:UDP-4-amino-4,6-dideoxy-N-acetyl-beta-L-altrosamine N-acetyltransferase